MMHMIGTRLVIYVTDYADYDIVWPKMRKVHAKQ